MAPLRWLGLSAGFVALAATMPALGVLPVGGLALLLGVERSCRRSAP